MNAYQRIATVVIAIAALGTWAAQTVIDMNVDGMDFLPAIWSQARYFTNWMVFGVGIFFAVQIANNNHASPSISAAMTVWIVLVGLVYHVLLSSTHHPVGGDIIVSLFQHTVIPVLAFLYWLVFADKRGLTYMHSLYWLACPMAYVIFVLLRGAFDASYPYFFLNPTEIGWAGVSGYIVGLGALFYVSGVALVGVSHPLRRDTFRQT